MVELARTKKCNECKKDCIREEMVEVDYMTKKGDIKTKMYCSHKCANAKETRKELVKNTNNLLESILEIPVRTNIYFNKLYSEIIKHYGYESMYNLLHSEYGYLCDSLNKDFVTTNVKIKYFMAIIQNKIEDYKDTKIDNEENENISNIEIVDTFKVEYKKKEKKSIFDI